MKLTEDQMNEIINSEEFNKKIDRLHDMFHESVGDIPELTKEQWDEKAKRIRDKVDNTQ